MTLDNWRYFLLNLDPRLKICCAFCAGVLTWQAQWGLLGVFLLTVMGLAWLLQGYGAINLKTLRYLALLVVIWTGIKALWGFWDTGPWQETAAASLLLGQRLAVLVLLGLVLTALCSCRQLGLAFDWFLRPMLGRKSWQAALALALMLHFIPLCLQTLKGVQAAVYLRCGQSGLYVRYRLLVRATFRILAHKTWEQTLALYARGLDQEAAWREPLPFQPLQWALGFCLIFLATFWVFAR